MTAFLPSRLSASDLAALRNAFREAEFTDAGVARKLGLDQARHFNSRDLPLLEEATADGGSLATLVRLFLIGHAVDSRAAEMALGAPVVAALAGAGLLHSEGGNFRAELLILPFRDLWIAYDRPERARSQHAADYVMGIGSSTLTLAQITVRRPCQKAFDLGCGGGVLALLAAGHCEQVVATDRNSRAVQVAALNAGVSDRTNVACIEGNLFEPVAGQRFDLIFSNPPFVVSPQSRYLYRDSGQVADALLRNIIQTVPAHLAEGGICQILCNWAHEEGLPWEQRLRPWFDDLGCDVIVLRSETLAAADYALKWIRHTENAEGASLVETFDQWMRFYRQQRIEAVSGGVICIRRRAGASNWLVFEESPASMLGEAGESILDMFGAHDFLAAHPDGSSLAGCRLCLHPSVRLFETCSASGGQWQSIAAELARTKGLAYRGNIDPLVARLVAGCDGKRTWGELLSDLAVEVGLTAGEVAAAATPVVQRLIAQGFLTPPG